MIENGGYSGIVISDIKGTTTLLMPNTVYRERVWLKRIFILKRMIDKVKIRDKVKVKFKILSQYL